MPSVQSFTIACEALNEHGTFSEGDVLRGKVTLALIKQISAESMFVKVTGDASVHWTKRVNDRTYTYSADHRYFKLKQPLIPEWAKDVIPPGTHVYDFVFNLPSCGMPSSFRGSHGKIVYKLTATLARSWRLDRTVEQELNFNSRSIPNLPTFLLQQICTTNKEMGFFSKGNVQMDVILDRRVFAPGETIAVVAKINNSSSSEMTPKFKLKCDIVYRAQGNTNHESSTIAIVSDQCVTPRTQKTVNCALQVPRDLGLSIQNCNLISVEYRLKAYLDISFASDPKVVFPLLICPHSMIHGGAARPHSASAAGGPSNCDFPPPAAAARPYPAGATGGTLNASVPPPFLAMGPYPYSAAPPPQYPAQPAFVRGSSPYPHLASPYGSQSSSSSVLHPPPAAAAPHPPPSAPEIPPMNTYPTPPPYNATQPSAPLMNTDFLSQQDEPPPSYSLLFPESSAGQSNSKQ
ncbi:hypothetical protein fugu_003994 [Takifugu bimaculatus]|uniref:Arrestin C-terminal-like domain-containing protein n=1 Tax=Takifugu bimaculatus TaxID=433685 RepID=A0A4Z2BF38_9TELE|nr:hypothetical protein fugu_003994 [Takifugu bimaculatus]